MAMTDANKAALAAFFATRRGGKQLQEDIQKGLLAYFVAKTHPGSRIAHVRDGAVLLYENPEASRGDTWCRSRCGTGATHAHAACGRRGTRCQHSCTLAYGVCVGAVLCRAYVRWRSRVAHPRPSPRTRGEEP